MKKFGRYVLIMIIFFIAAMAFMEVDRRCSQMYGREGRIVEKAAEAVSIAAGVFESEE